MNQPITVSTQLIVSINRFTTIGKLPFAPGVEQNHE
jgi:hypothetical protein